MPGPSCSCNRPLPRRVSLAARIRLAALAYGVPDADPATPHDVRAQAAAVHQAAQHAEIVVESRELRTRLGELRPDGLDLADGEALADQRVQVDPAREHV